MKLNNLITRKQYMANEFSHYEYYKQYAPIFKNYVLTNFEKDDILKKYAADEHLNNLGNLNGVYWLDRFDMITLIYKSKIADINFKINGARTYSLSTGTCAIKAAIKLYILNI